MASKEFYVDTDALNAVAKQIQTLLDQISDDDATAGTYTQFKKASSIDAPTKTFWKGPNAYADAYGYEYKYVCKTFDTLISQLTDVMKACTSTASQYGQHEKTTKKQVTQASPDELTS